MIKNRKIIPKSLKEPIKSSSFSLKRKNKIKAEQSYIISLDLITKGQSRTDEQDTEKKKIRKGLNINLKLFPPSVEGKNFRHKTVGEIFYSMLTRTIIRIFYVGLGLIIIEFLAFIASICPLKVSLRALCHGIGEWGRLWKILGGTFTHKDYIIYDPEYVIKHIFHFLIYFSCFSFFLC